MSISSDFIEVYDDSRVEVLALAEPEQVEVSITSEGFAGTIAVGTVTTGAPGSAAVVANAGTLTQARLNFTIPRGDVGATGTAAAITSISATTLAEGAAATATAGGTATARTFAFGIPRGNTGATGPSGTITSATAALLAAGATPTVTLGGTPQARTMEFGIPKGDKGDQGIQGIQGPSGTITSATATGLAAGATPTITLGGTAQARTLAFGIPKGDKGDTGATGPTGPPGPAGAAATAGALGTIQLAGDLGGTATAPQVTSGTNHTHTRAQVSDASTLGRTLMAVADAAAARTAIGAGTGNVAGTGITAIQSLTQAAYDALTTKVATTLYVIVG
jgi:collagen type VII alpha